VRVGELQAALERWGTAPRPRKTDTVFVRREKPSPPADLLDHAFLAELRGMQPSDGAPMLKELIDLFLENAPQRIAHLNQFLEDPQKMAFHAHALKSMSLNLGARKLVEICQRLEELGHSGNIEGSVSLLRELEQTYKLTESELRPMRSEVG
jgi:HPt (histidine-containing phosphotransfer) domain-containing protein